MNNLRTIKISFKNSNDFEIINTDAPDDAILTQLTYNAICAEEHQSGLDPYAVLKAMEYTVNIVYASNKNIDNYKTSFFETEFFDQKGAV